MDASCMETSVLEPPFPANLLSCLLLFEAVSKETPEAEIFLKTCLGKVNQQVELVCRKMPAFKASVHCVIFHSV